MARATLTADRAGSSSPGALTLSEDDRRVLAGWAADCAERVLPLFEVAAPHDERPRLAIDGLRAFARGELRIGAARALSVAAHSAAREVADPAAIAAARAAGQAVATAHMGAHARGAPAYALLALQGAGRDPEALAAEMRWQWRHASGPVREALRRLPMPQDGGGVLGRWIRDLDAAIRSSNGRP